MGATPPALAWQTAYRQLYSALRKDHILDRCVGFFVLAAHSQSAALVNWAGSASATAIGAPGFTAGQGFVFGGDNYLDTGVSMGASGVTTTNASAGVWPGFEDQPNNIAAIGDGVFELHPNREPTAVGSRGWAASTSVDVSTAVSYGSFLGAARVAQDRFTTYLSGGLGEVKLRDYISGYPSRPVYIGATNQSTGVGKHYTGLIRGAFFGQSLNAVQMLAAQAAMARFFKQIEAV